jgi:glycosyltransferase involved in cell wall biosynthesis
MPKQLLVDVAIATYNHEGFIAQAIECVLAQETDFAYRIIIGDDCSEDQTQPIIKAYAQKHPDLITTILYSEHRGLIHKERVGIKVLERCTAKYVALLDGDDYWTNPHKLQKQVAFLEQHPDFVTCFHDVEIFGDDGKKLGESRPPSQKETFTIEDLLTESFMQTSSVLFRRQLIGKLPDWYHTSALGDWPLNIMVAQHGKIRYLNEVMGAYRIHGQGLWSAKTLASKLNESIKILDHVNKHLAYKYHHQIRTTQCRLCEALTKMYDQEGDSANARRALAKGIRLGLSNNRLPSKQQLSKLLRLQSPGLYNLFRSLKNFNRS